MGHYIDKDSLEKDIERRRDNCKKVVWDLRNQENKDYYQGKAEAYSDVLSTISSLDVRDVDLEKELIEWHKKHFKKEGTFIGMSGFYLTNNSQMDIAKHFFELGLKTQKDSIRHSMDETPKYPCDILFVTNVDNVFLYRYMENGRPVDKDTPYFHNIQNGKCWYYCNDIMNVH